LASLILLLLSTYKEHNRHEDNMTSGKMSVKKFWNKISCLLIKKRLQYYWCSTQK